MELDLSAFHSAIQPYSSVVAGGMFGAAWSFFADAVAYNGAIEHRHFSILFVLPGLVATLALLVMNSIPRSDIGESADEETQSRSKCVLLVSYLLAVGAVVGSVAVLISGRQKSQDVWLETVSVL